MTKLYRYRFGAAQFDEARFELSIGGVVIDVQPRPLQILSILLARGGALVTREELFEQVWAGRPTVPNVLPNAITKLRTALGPELGALIENQPRVGYRFAGAAQRTAVGQAPANPLELRSGMAVPGREAFVLTRALAQARGHEAWLVHHRPDGAAWVFKFATDQGSMAALRREVGLSRILRSTLGERPDLLVPLDWSFEQTPAFVATRHGGPDLLAWSSQAPGLVALSQRQRVALLVQIADALAAAHRVGVLHKDLKPENVLVAAKGDDWQISLCDFGSGRLLEPERLAALGATSFGLSNPAEMLEDGSWGSLRYLAPELLQDQPATPRSDVYALGVLLYQLLVGDLRRPLLPDWQQDIGDPLLREDIQAATARDPGQRTVSVEVLAASLRDLDARAARRVAAERARAEEERNARELQGMRARRPWVFAAIGMLAAGLLVTLVLYQRVRAVEDDLARQVVMARALNRFLQEDFIAAANPAISGRADMSVIEAARSAATQIDSRFGAGSPALRQDLHAAMAQALLGLSDYAGAAEEARRGLSGGSAGGAPSAAVRGRAVDSDHAADLEISLAIAQGELGAPADEARSLDAAWRLITASGREQSPLATRYWYGRGHLETQNLRIDDALAAYGRARALAREQPELPHTLADNIDFYYALALRMGGQFGPAREATQALLQRQGRRLPADHPVLCKTRLLLASILGYQNATAEAIPIARDAAACLDHRLGPDSPMAVTAQQILGDLLFQSDRYADAAEVYQRVARSDARTHGDDALLSIMIASNAAVALQYAGQLERADGSLTSLLARARTALGWDHPAVQNIRYHLADCRLDQRRAAGVAALLVSLDPNVLNRSQIAPDWDGRLAYQRGRLALLSGRPEQAAPELQAALDIIAAKNPDGRVTPAKVRTLLAEAHTAQRHGD